MVRDDNLKFETEIQWDSTLGKFKSKFVDMEAKEGLFKQ